MDRDELYLSPTQDGNYQLGKKKIEYSKRLGELLETDRMRKHLQEDGSYPASSFTEKVQEEVKKQAISFEKQIEQLSQNTLLAEREAEAYILTEKLGHTIQEAADEMDVGFGRVSGARNRIKEKIEKAEKTAELDL